MGLGPIGRVRRREVPRRVVLAPVDENLDSRPSVLLRLRRRRRTSPGPATAWWLRRGDSARAACPARNLTSGGGRRSAVERSPNCWLRGTAFLVPRLSAVACRSWKEGLKLLLVCGYQLVQGSGQTLRSLSLADRFFSY